MARKNCAKAWLKLCRHSSRDLKVGKEKKKETKKRNKTRDKKKDKTNKSCQVSQSLKIYIEASKALIKAK